MAKHWQAVTPKDKKLPEKVGKKKESQASFAAFADELIKIADLSSLVLGQLARRKVTPPVAQAVAAAEETLEEKWRRLKNHIR